MEQIRVMIADDHELVRYGLRALLDAETDIEVVGEATDCASAVECCQSTRPDVLLLDLRMPGKGGIEVCREVVDSCPGTSVLVLTSFDEDEDIFGVTAAGASGYVLKDTKPEWLVRAVRSVADGQSVFDTGVANRIISGRSDSVDNGADPLSEREMEVLQLMAKGFSNKEIGRSLWIGETTVKTHVSHILRKLGAADRTQAVLTAVKSGLVRITS